MKTLVLVIYSSRLKIKDLLLMPQKIYFFGVVSVSSELSETVAECFFSDCGTLSQIRSF